MRRTRVRRRVERGGTLEVAPDAVLGEGTRIEVRAGAHVVIGPGASVGEDCVIVAHQRIEVGPGARLGDRVLLVDADPRFADVEQPVRLQGIVCSPVSVGAGASIGHGAALLRGAVVAAGAVVDPGVVVTRRGPARMLRPKRV